MADFLQTTLQSTGTIQAIVSAIAMIGASVLVVTGNLSGQETISVYTLVLGYVFGSSRG